MELIKKQNQNLAPADQEKRALVLSENWGIKSAEIFPMSTSKAMHSKTPSIAAIRRFSGNEAAFATIGSMIGEVCRFLNVGKTMNQAQIPMTVQLIMKDFYFLKVADIKLAFMNGLSGKYGKAFDRLDGQILLLWLEEYSKERAEVAQLASINNHDAAKNEKWTPEAAAKFKALHEKWTAKQSEVSKDSPRFWANNLKYKAAGITDSEFKTVVIAFQEQADNTKHGDKFIQACNIGGQDPKEFFVWSKLSELRNQFNKAGGFDLVEHVKKQSNDSSN